MRLSLVLLFLSAGCSAALAQDLGGFVGTVTDSSGALIPDATVTISNADKGFARQVVSNTSGEYVVPRAPLGAYSSPWKRPVFRS